MALRLCSLRLRSPNRRLGREWSRWTKRVMPEPASPASPVLLPIECKYQSGSLSLHETPNINIALVPRFSGKPRGNSVRSGDRSDQRSPPKQSSEPPTFRMPTRPNLMRPRGPRLPRDSALDAMKDILDIRRGVSKQCMGENRKPPARKHMQATMMLGRPNQRWAATAQKWQRNSLGRVMVCSPRAAPPCIDRRTIYYTDGFDSPFGSPRCRDKDTCPRSPNTVRLGNCYVRHFQKRRSPSPPLSLFPALLLALI